MLGIKVKKKCVSGLGCFASCSLRCWSVGWPVLPAMGQIINILGWCATLVLSQLLILIVVEQKHL